MGIITKITLEEIQQHFECKTLQPSTDGVSDSVYFLDNNYILKVFEAKEVSVIEEEVKLLKICEGLKVPKLIKKDFFIHDKPALIYQKCAGVSLQKVAICDLEEIGKFLQSFHHRTTQKESKNSELFTKERLLGLIEKTGYEPFINSFHHLDIELKNDGIIHGDLFLDNATFVKRKLSCVFDFSEACNGDFLFDVAVVALSWCENKKDIISLLESYGATIQFKDFIPYIQYAGLYYSVTRYLGKRDFQALQKRLECILN